MDINPRNILVVQIGKLGDMVLTNPLFYELKRLFPSASLKVLASEVNLEFVSSLKVVDEVIVYKKNIFKDLFLASKLKKQNFDLWIDPKDGHSRTTSALLKVARPKLSLGYNHEEKVFDVDLKDFVKGKHAVDLALAPIYYFGKEPVHLKPVLNDFLEDTSSRKPIDVVINVSSGNPSRYLPLEKWIAILSAIIHKHPSLKIRIVGIRVDSKLIADIHNTFKSEYITHKYDYNMKALVNALNRAKIIITPDTSIVHLASGLNKPIIALYPKVDWNYERFKPLSDNFEAVISNSEEGIEDIKSTDLIKRFEVLAEKVGFL